MNTKLNLDQGLHSEFNAISSVRDCLLIDERIATDMGIGCNTLFQK